MPFICRDLVWETAPSLLGFLLLITKLTSVCVEKGELSWVSQADFRVEVVSSPRTMRSKGGSSQSVVWGEFTGAEMWCVRVPGSFCIRTALLLNTYLHSNSELEHESNAVWHLNSNLVHFYWSPMRSGPWSPLRRTTQNFQVIPKHGH